MSCTGPRQIQQLLWVGSGSSALYHPNGRFRVVISTGRSATIFQNPKSERLLFPKAVVQNARKTTI
jgi:hypothetical protein